MKNFLKRLFGLSRVKPITHRDVAPAAPPPEKAAEVKAATTQLVQELMKVERSSVDVRLALAGNALKFVSGGN